MPLVVVDGQKYRVTAGNGLIGEPPTDGTPVLRGLCVPMGPRPQLPGGAGTFNPASAAEIAATAATQAAAAAGKIAHAETLADNDNDNDNEARERHAAKYRVLGIETPTMQFWVRGQLVDGGLLPLPPTRVRDALNGGASAAGGASSVNDSPTPDSHAERTALLDSHAQRTALLELRRAMATGGAADYDSDATVVIEDDAQLEQDREKRAGARRARRPRGIVSRGSSRRRVRGSSACTRTSRPRRAVAKY